SYKSMRYGDVRFRVRAPLFKEPAHKAGFCFSATGLSIELRSIIRRKVVFICNDIGWKLAY
ncbi:hypothetical protein, partial [Klebsiella grimontii]|uniref:hypothetical protein n=1 Tax=Klebsiella grimontii TaxID=2058152 RepID=UPI001AED807C